MCTHHRYVNMLLSMYTDYNIISSIAIHNKYATLRPSNGLNQKIRVPLSDPGVLPHLMNIVKLACMFISYY